MPCRSAQVVLLAPLSGPAQRVGREQEAWARWALAAFRQSPAARIELVAVDTGQEPARAQAAAALAAGQARVAAVVGPRTSAEALAAGRALALSGLPLVSPSASATALADGRLQRFFRVVPNDDAQAAAAARLLQTLGARRVLVLDDAGSPDSLPLAAAVAGRLRTAGATVVRATARPDLDVAAVAELVPPDADAVFLAWQLPARAQALGRLLRERGSRAEIVASAGLASPGELVLEGAYVLSAVPQPRPLPTAANASGIAGPATFVAVRAAVNAIVNACRDGRATRAEVVTWLRRTYLVPTPLGRPFAFDARGQPRAAGYTVLRIRGGRYLPVPPG